MHSPYLKANNLFVVVLTDMINVVLLYTYTVIEENCHKIIRLKLIFPIMCLEGRSYDLQQEEDILGTYNKMSLNT